MTMVEENKRSDYDDDDDEDGCGCSSSGVYGI